MDFTGFPTGFDGIPEVYLWFGLSVVLAVIICFWDND